MRNSDKEVERVKKLPAEERVLENHYQNKEFDKVFSLIGEPLEGYDKVKSFRNGCKKIHSGKLRSRIMNMEGKTVD